MCIEVGEEDLAWNLLYRCRNEILIGGRGGHSYGKEWLSVCVGENFE